MTNTGLSDREIEMIRSVLRRHPEVSEAVLFGSRAKGTWSPGSDIDMMLRGIDDPLRAESIAAELDELPTPYQFDVRAESDVRSADLREHIARVGVIFYE